MVCWLVGSMMRSVLEYTKVPVRIILASVCIWMLTHAFAFLWFWGYSITNYSRVYYFVLFLILKSSVYIITPSILLHLSQMWYDECTNTIYVNFKTALPPRSFDRVICK